MSNEKFRELPFTAKDQMAKDIAKIIHGLHHGILQQTAIQDLKERSLHLSDQIQQDVMVFIGQVEFQYRDAWGHNVTHEVKQAADQLLRDLGLSHYLRAS